MSKSQSSIQRENDRAARFQMEQFLQEFDFDELSLEQLQEILDQTGLDVDIEDLKDIAEDLGILVLSD